MLKSLARTALLTLSLSLPASASIKGIFEGVPSSNSTILVSTRTGRVLMTGVRVSSAAHFVASVTSDSSGTFRASGTTQYSLQTSSGITVGAGGVVASFFSGNAFSATGLAANGTNCSPGNYPLGVDQFGNSENCTAAATGDVTSSGNNTFSGINKFSGHTTFTGATSHQGAVYFTAASTIGPQGYVSAATTSSGTLNNMWQVVGSNAPSSVMASTFTALVSNRWYRLRWSLVQNTSNSRIKLRFNGDQTAYYWGSTGNNDQGTVVNSNGTGDDECFTTAATSVGAAYPSAGEFSFVTSSTSSLVTNSFWKSTYTDANPFTYNEQGSCRHVSNSALSSVALYTDAGTFTGYVYLEELIVPNP